MKSESAYFPRLPTPKPRSKEKNSSVNSQKIRVPVALFYHVFYLLDFIVGGSIRTFIIFENSTQMTVSVKYKNLEKISGYLLN